MGPPGLEMESPFPTVSWLRKLNFADSSRVWNDQSTSNPSMINLSIFPNLLIKGNHIETIDPISVAETRLHTWVAAAADAPEEVNVLRMRIAEDFPSLGNPDDLELFERCQLGLGIAEIEWIDMSKGFGDPAEEVSDEGVRRGPVTHEVPMRGYIRAWRELMEADPKRVVVGPGGVVREVAG